MKKKMMLAAALALLAFGAYAQKKDSIALLPFTGGQSRDGEYIVSELARQRVFRDAFNSVTLVTRTTQAFMRFEQKFQRDSGLTDADTVFELGKQLNMQYVIAGYITKFGSQNLVMASILDVESLQLVAGDYRPYKNIEDIDAMIPDIARKLAESVRRDTKGLPGLSVPPFETDEDVSASDAQVLAQILAINLANGNKYAVLPRTDSIEKVMDEHRRQRSGETDQERVRRLGKGLNAEYVLAGSVIKMGSLNKLTADILNIENGSFIDGYSEKYNAFTEGVDLAPKLAAGLNGTAVAAAPAAPVAPPSPPSPPRPVVPSGFVQVSAGTFSMGGNANDIHQVTISKSFYMSNHEVTQKEWMEVMGSNPSYFKGDNLPVENVSWFDALEYCNRRSIKEGLTPAYSGSGDYITCDFKANGYRLPTEAEWEWAAKGGGKDFMVYEYSGSNSVDTVAWYSGNSGGKTHPVKTKAPNSLGLYDMSGNVREWCWDWYGSYSSGAQTDPTGASSGTYRVSRGGGWGDGAGLVRVAARDGGPPSYRYYSLGLRLVRP